MSADLRTIFITIAACREYFLTQTIESAIKAAKYPERVYFGIFNTILENKFSMLDENGKLSDRSILNSKNIFYTEFISPTPMGTGFSRMNASLLSDRDHDFVLQIDAHTIFDKDWDVEIINNYSIAEKYTDRPFVLTSQPHGWNYDLQDKTKTFLISAGQTRQIDPLNFNSKTILGDKDRLRSGVPNIILDGKLNSSEINSGMVGKAWVDSGVYDESKKITLDGITFYEGNCVYAAHLFYPYKYLMDILHYPKDWFYGDQINYSLRLISRGFKIFHFYYPTFIALGKLDFDISRQITTDRDPENSWRAINLSGNQQGKDYRHHIQYLSEEHHKDIFSGKYLNYWGSPDRESLAMAKQIMNLEGYLD